MAGLMPPAALVSAGLILLLPFVVSLLAHLTGLEFGPLFIAPAFMLAASRSLSLRRAG